MTLIARVAAVSSLAVAFAGAGTATAADGPATRPAGRIEGLSDRLRALASDVARTTVPRLNSHPFVIPKPHVESLPRVSPRYVTPRSEWIPREFNGMTYYLIPCDALAAVTAAKAAPLVPATPPRSK